MATLVRVQHFRRPLLRAPYTAPLMFTVWGDPGIERELDPADWGGSPDVYLEIHGKTSDAGLPILARLYNLTAGAAIGGSLISSASTTKTRARSNAFSLAAGANTYVIQFGGQSGADYTLYDGVVIIDT